MANTVIAAELVIKGLKESGMSVKDLKETIEGMKDELKLVEKEFGKTSDQVKVTKQAIDMMEGAVKDFEKSSTQSVKSFKAQLLEAKERLYAVTAEFGATSDQAAMAAMKVADLNDVIGDAKALTEDFNPDKKFDSLAGALGGVTAGFAAYSGAMGLLGIESEETEKLLLRVQSAMALQQGISGIMGAKDSFELLGASILRSTLFTKANTIVTSIAAGVQRLFGVSVVGTGVAFNVLKAAIIATGIGALVVIIGTLISKMDMFTGATEKAADAQQRLADATTNLNEALKGSVESLDRDIELKIKRAKAAGASEAELTAIERKGLQDRIDLRNKSIDYAITNGLSIKEITEAQGKDINALQDFDLDQQIKRNEQRKSDGDKAAEARKQLDKQKSDDAAKALQQEIEDGRASIQNVKDINDYEKRERERVAAEKLEDDEKERQALRDKNQLLLETKAQIAELNLLDDPDSIDNKIAKINADLELELFALAEGDLRRQILAKQASDAIVQIKEEEAEAKKQISEKELQFQQTVVAGIANGLDTLADIAGKQTAAGKVLAIASTVIKTIQGGIAAFTGMVSSIPGPVGIALGAVAAAGVVASGVKAVKQITAVKIPGGGGGGGSPNISLPDAPILPRADATRLDQSSINAVGNAASRAYVLETDVSGNQERVRRLNRAARIN